MTYFGLLALVATLSFMLLIAVGLRLLLNRHERRVEAEQRERTERHETFLRFLADVRDAAWQRRPE
jgi:hypothetical protein